MVQFPCFLARIGCRTRQLPAVRTRSAAVNTPRRQENISPRWRGDGVLGAGPPSQDVLTMDGRHVGLYLAANPMSAHTIYYPPRPLSTVLDLDLALAHLWSTKKKNRRSNHSP